MLQWTGIAAHRSRFVFPTAFVFPTSRTEAYLSFPPLSCCINTFCAALCSSCHMMRCKRTCDCSESVARPPDALRTRCAGARPAWVPASAPAGEPATVVRVLLGRQMLREQDALALDQHGCPQVLPLEKNNPSQNRTGLLNRS